MKPLSQLFAKLRARQEQRATEKARRNFAEEARRHAAVMERARQAGARFLAAERIGAPDDVLRKLAEEANAACAEMHAMNHREKEEIANALKESEIRTREVS